MKKELPEINQKLLFDHTTKSLLINKYKPKLCKTRPWTEIEYSFDNFFGGQNKNNLLKLVIHIQETGLANRLFALTSMNKLVVGIYNPLEWDRETLHITYDTENSEWHFVYYSLPFQKPEFIRNYSNDKGIEKFDKFIRMIGW